MLYLEKFKNSDTYKVKFIHAQVGTVIGYLMNPPTITNAASWSTAVEQRFNEGIMGSAYQYATGLMGSGRALTVGELTKVRWQSTEPTQVSFEVAYVAIYDAYTEVVEPIKKLLKFTQPKEFYVYDLKPPLNTLGGEYVSIEGPYFYMTELVPVSVTPNFGHVYDTSGHPISATCTLAFQSARVMSMNDIEAWFF